MQTVTDIWEPERRASVSRPTTQGEPVVRPVTYGPPPFHPLEDIRAIWREWRNLLELRRDLERSAKPK
jgi:hypothetical protein